MLEFLESVYQFLLGVVAFVGSIPPEFWVTVGGALGVSVLMQTIKHKLELSNPKVIIFVTTTLAFLASGIEYLIFAAGQDPTILGQYTTVTLGISTLLYRVLIQPGYNFFLEVKEFQEAKKSGELDDVEVETINAAEVFPAITLTQTVQTTTTNEPETQQKADF